MCLQTGAAYLEVSYTMSTNLFLIALWRPVAKRWRKTPWSSRLCWLKFPFNQVIMLPSLLRLPQIGILLALFVIVHDLSRLPRSFFSQSSDVRAVSLIASRFCVLPVPSLSEVTRTLHDYCFDKIYPLALKIITVQTIKTHTCPNSFSSPPPVYRLVI